MRGYESLTTAEIDIADKLAAEIYPTIRAFGWPSKNGILQDLDDKIGASDPVPDLLADYVFEVLDEMHIADCEHNESVSRGEYDD